MKGRTSDGVIFEVLYIFPQALGISSDFSTGSDQQGVLQM
jgi:hypothetical protein